jgi:hypothetical protein
LSARSERTEEEQRLTDMQDAVVGYAVVTQCPVVAKSVSLERERRVGVLAEVPLGDDLLEVQHRGGEIDVQNGRMARETANGHCGGRHDVHSTRR